MITTSLPATIAKLRDALRAPLPGLAAQMQMAPQPRLGTERFLDPDLDCRRAGVLVLLYGREDELCLVLTRRTESVNIHQGQISFPGGSMEPDESATATAFREAREELAIIPEILEYLGELSPLYIPPSHFCIYPVVAYTPERPRFTPNPDEVAEVIEVPLAHFLAPGTRHVEIWQRHDQPSEVPFYAVGPHKVWGATAMVLCELSALLTEIAREVPEMESELRQLVSAFAQRKVGRPARRLRIEARSPWDLHVAFDLPGLGKFEIRNLCDGDARTLHAFGRQLGPLSKELFDPFPWDDPPGQEQAFRRAVEQAVNKVDASYLIRHAGAPMGYFFLWKAGGNPLSQAHGLEVPELGVAIGDAYQRQGWGGLAVRALQAVARNLRADGIELTTAPSNEKGWRAYLRAGFEYVGIVRVRLGVDVTAAHLGEVTASRYRDERQMVYVINGAKRDAILRYLASKRSKAA